MAELSSTLRRLVRLSGSEERSSAPSVRLGTFAARKNDLCNVEAMASFRRKVSTCEEKLASAGRGGGEGSSASWRP